MLKRLGFKVIEAEDGIQAIELFGEYQDEIGSSLFSVGNGSLCIGFADPGTRPRTPGIYRFEVQTWLL